MPVSVAYVIVVLIWSTTPLGIVWSSETIDPTVALLGRMVIALVLGFLLMPILKVNIDWRPKALQVYLYSSLSLAIGMLCCYLAARHISSGLMSLSFGIAPILSGYLAQKIIGENKFSTVKKVALFIALTGLTIVCWENLANTQMNYIGLIFISGGVFMFSLSGVLVKSVNIELHPLSTTMGSLLVSLPMFIIFWWLNGANFNPDNWQPRAVMSMVYLGVFASLIGFLAYFFILKNLLASTVALVVVITPILSTLLGIAVNDELFTANLIIGGFFVVSGLLLFQYGHQLPWRRKQVVTE